MRNDVPFADSHKRTLFFFIFTKNSVRSPWKASKQQKNSESIFTSKAAFTVFYLNSVVSHLSDCTLERVRKWVGEIIDSVLCLDAIFP